MDIAVSNINITQVPADLVVMKYADGFHGADLAVSAAVDFHEHVPAGQTKFCTGSRIAAREVAFIGVGPLYEFRYEQIQEFGRAAIILTERHERPIQHLAMTMHGPGYGLNAEQAFLSLIAGIITEWKPQNSVLRKITVAELSDKRCELLRKVLQEAPASFGLQNKAAQQAVAILETSSSVPNPRLATHVMKFGARAAVKPRLFVAMPFVDKFLDEFEIGFHEAAKANDFICERLDVESFVGDIVAEIKQRIIDSHGVIALLNDHNPNVFLEVGFAFAHGKPTILVAKDGLEIPFDVRGHRCIRYRSITELRELLRREIASLKLQGVLGKHA